ncbi:hypothetical protein L2K20_32985, partial [Mycobacterium sp. MBM]|nr:hypothetical protein [Mycobacterium sp. MBM]
GSGKDPRAGAVAIYALTDQLPAAEQDSPGQGVPGSAGTPESVTAQTEPGSEAGAGPEPQVPAAESDPAEPAEPAEPAAEPAEPAASARPAAPAACTPPAACNPSPAVMLDGAIIPAHLLAELVAGGATIKP